jgi:hypothetical protein
MVIFDKTGPFYHMVYALSVPKICSSYGVTNCLWDDTLYGPDSQTKHSIGVETTVYISEYEICKITPAVQLCCCFLLFFFSFLFFSTEKIKCKMSLMLGKGPRVRFPYQLNSVIDIL